MTKPDKTATCTRNESLADNVQDLEISQAYTGVHQCQEVNIIDSWWLGYPQYECRALYHKHSSLQDHSGVTLIVDSPHCAKYTSPDVTRSARIVNTLNKMADVLHTLFPNTFSEWKLMYRMVHFMAWRTSVPMGLLPDTLNCACAGNTGNVFPGTALSIPTCITARAVMHARIAN